MATFKREIKKLPSEQNLKLLSSLVISLANKTSSVEDKCIAPWKAGETYQKDVSFVVYNGYIYFCTVTNKDAVFTESHWMKLADNFDELSVDDVKAFLNLTPEQLQTLSSIISTEIRLDKTFSSSDTYMRIQAAIDTAKEYTNNQLGKAVKPAYKVVSSTSEVTETGYFYLISNSTNFDMYVLSSDGTVVSLGTSDVDLSNYYTKTETDSDFLKKTDATSTYATITTVDGKMDKKTIATIIGNDNVETHDQLVSAKAAAELKRRVFSRPAGESILDYADSIDTSKDNVSVTVRSMDCPDAPYGTTGTISNDCYYTISKIYNTNDYCVIEAKDIRTNNKYIRMKTAGTWYDWVGVLEQGNVITMCQLSNGGRTRVSSWIDSKSGNILMSMDIVNPDGKVCRIQFDNNTGTFYSFKYDGTKWISTGHYCMTKINDSTNLTADIGSHTLKNNKVIVKNGVVEFCIMIDLTSDIASWNTIATLPIKPMVAYRQVNLRVYRNPGGYVTTDCHIGESGELQSSYSLKTGDQIVLSGMYVAANS